MMRIDLNVMKEIVSNNKLAGLHPGDVLALIILVEDTAGLAQAVISKAVPPPILNGRYSGTTECGLCGRPGWNEHPVQHAEECPVHKAQRVLELMKVQAGALPFKRGS